MEMVIYDAFRKAGVEESQARAIASELNKNFKTAMNEVAEHHYSVHSQQLATRGDVEKVRLDVETLRIATKVDTEQLRLEIEKVRADLEKAKAEIIKWNVGAIIAAVGLAMAAMRLFFAT